MMLNYAAWREFTNADIKSKAKRDKEDDDPFIPEMGATMSEIEQNPELMDAYMSDWSSFG
jgi:hypothetical protein